MKWDSNNVVKLVDGTDYVDIVAKGHKYAGSDTADW